MPVKSNFFLFFTGFLLLGSFSCPPGLTIKTAYAADEMTPQKLPLIPLEIKSQSNAIHKLTVDVARTDAQRSIGLMFRKSMAKDRGMLFLFRSPQPVAFWMRNTYIPLDLLFIDVTGAVVTIAENAKPQSLDLIPSNAAVVAVLEINGGLARSLGIKPGDQIIQPNIQDAIKENVE